MTETRVAVIISAAQTALTPAPRDWTMARIATLLTHYFVPNTDTKVATAIAKDWAFELKDHPAWAIVNACRWWISADNPLRRQKPVPGDIADRAAKESETCRMAPEVAARMLRIAPQPEVDRSQMPAGTVEQRRAFAQQAMRDAAARMVDKPRDPGVAA